MSDEKIYLFGQLVITTYVYPPIPIRNFDWCAYLDSTGPEGEVGWGKTKEEAVAELKEILEDELDQNVRFHGE